MRIAQKHTTRHFMACIVALMTMMLLAACSETGKGNSTGAFTPTATLLRQGVAMKIFTGPDFIIRYPADWKSTAAYGPAIFVDPTRTYDLLIGSKPNPDGLIPPEQVIKNGLATWPNTPVPVSTMSVTETIGGQIWSRRAVVGNDYLLKNGKLAFVELVTLVTNYPKQSADTKTYSIIYEAPASLFSQISNLYFTPMLRSFAFTT